MKTEAEIRELREAILLDCHISSEIIASERASKDHKDLEHKRQKISMANVAVLNWILGIAIPTADLLDGFVYALRRAPPELRESSAKHADRVHKRWGSARN